MSQLKGGQRRNAIMPVAVLLFMFFTNVLSQTDMFPATSYIATINEETMSNTVIQQIVVVPSTRPTTITYSIESNNYVDINKTTGEVRWKQQGLVLQNDTSLTVTALDGLTLAQATATLNLVNSTDACPCFSTAQRVLTVDVSENLNPFTLLYLSQDMCGDNIYSLDEGMENIFHISNGRLMIQSLDYEATPRLRTTITCKEDALELTFNVKNEVDLAPHTRIVGTKIRTNFIQYNYTVDEHQLDSLLGDKKSKALTVYMDGGGSPNKWRVIQDPHKQLIAGSLRPYRAQPDGYIPAFLMVSHAKSLLIDESTDIDIVIVDDNLPSDGKHAVSNNVTFRFSLTLKTVDELKSLDLDPSYRLELFENTPLYTQVLRIGHNFSKALLFELRPLGGNSECHNMLNVTPHQGIIYVGEKGNLSQCHIPAKYVLKVSQGGTPRISTVTVTWLPAPNVTGSHSVSCADYTSEVACEGGRGAGSPNCIWKSMISSRANFSTCVPNDDCLNMECSELEELDRSICPQDCLMSTEWSGVTSIICGRSDLGLCAADGVCHCEENALYCKCLPESEIGQFIFNNKDDDGNTSSIHITTGESNRPVLESCGLQCTVVISVIVAIIIIVIVVISLWYKYKPTKHIHKVEDGINAFRVGGINLNTNLTANTDYEGSTPSTVLSLLPEWPDSLYHNTGSMELYDEKWELCRDNLVIGDYIGEGEFGRVLKAQYRKCLLDDWSPVAVKMLKDGASRTEYNDLLSEYSLLKEVDHPNVIKLIGAATLNGPFHLVVEYCELGSLKSYLRNIRTREPDYINGANQFYSEYADQLMSFSYQISKGMQYLSEIKLVHRDLATRNILIAADKVVKISDFGMTKDVYEENAYKKKGQGRIPVKWMAPESLFHLTYTAKSDVWSFGVLLWEIATLGATPYPGIPAERMYNLLQEGYRMCRPETCTPALYSLMRKCWEYEDNARPSFKELRLALEKMIDDEETTYLDLSVAADSRRQCHGSSSLSTNSSDDSETQQLTVALIPSTESKFVEDYLVSTNVPGSKEERQPLRYTTLEFADEE